MRLSSPPDFQVVGHVTRDRIRIGDAVRRQPGGAAWYAGLALHRLGGTAAVLTKTAPADRTALLGDFERAGIDVTWRPSAATTTFENVYPDADLERREQTVPAVADPFVVEDLAGVRAPVLLLGPLTAGDMPLPFLRAAADRGAVCLDAQGMVRRVIEGRIVHEPWPERDAGLGAVAFLKADADEAAVLTGEADPERAAHRLASRLGHTPHEAVVTRAGRGAVICTGDRLYRSAAFPVAAPLDATGLGDTFFAAYLRRRLAGDDVPGAGRFAAATAALALGRFGPFAGSERQVRALLRRAAEE